jgi:hypothetical protein
LLFRFRFGPRPAGWGVVLAVLASIFVILGLGRNTCVKSSCIVGITYYACMYVRMYVCVWGYIVLTFVEQ